MSTESHIYQIPELAQFLKEADFIDIKTIEGDISLREFVAGFLSYQPGWVTFLFYIRQWFVRLLGMKQEDIPQAPQMRPEDVPMNPGEPAHIFTVRSTAEDHYWMGEIKDTHLDAALGVVVEPLAGEAARFHVITIVHYNNWAGPVYFNVIRPFHHLVVNNMMRAIVRG